MPLVFTAKNTAQMTTWFNSSILKANTQSLFSLNITEGEGVACLPHATIPPLFSSLLLQYDFLLLKVMPSFLTSLCKVYVCITYLLLTTWREPEDIHLVPSAGKCRCGAQPQMGRCWALLKKTREDSQAKQHPLWAHHTACLTNNVETAMGLLFFPRHVRYIILCGCLWLSSSLRWLFSECW